MKQGHNLYRGTVVTIDGWMKAGVTVWTATVGKQYLGEFYSFDKACGEAKSYRDGQVR